MSSIETKVSVILTSYNKPKLLEKAIESVLKQTMPNWELWIMDDHSNAETVQTIERHLEDPRIRYRNSEIEDKERHQSTRYATMINEAIPLSKGRYLTYLTDDTIYAPDRLEEMVAYLEKNAGIDIVYSAQQVKVVNEQMVCLKEYTREANVILVQAADKVDHCSVMHTREILQQVRDRFGSYWDDDPQHWCRGDAVFWKRLNTFQSFHPLSKVLDITYKTSQSVQSLFQHLPASLPNGILVKGTSEKIYLLNNGQRRLINPAMFSFYKYDPKKIVNIPDPLLYRYEEGIPFDKASSLPPFRLFQDKDGDVFYLEQKQRRRITNPLLLMKNRFNRQEIIQAEEERLRKIPVGPNVDSHFSEPLLENKVYKNHIQYWLMSDCSLLPIDKKVLQRLKLDHDPIAIPSNKIKKWKIGPPIVSGYL
ncbi:glycosyltransferase family A protein [Bacillus sp. SD088]|uniref:glycosyltransferase family A protein n=1 Tax=Bacillus sp. SD088 TaxID=2782012 RepID=UPI0028BE6C39|nr:glycosyltransferase family 2 protein [Bacillus sp. SD088]